MLRYIFICCSLLLTSALTAQSFTLSGAIVDPNDEAVGSLTIELLDADGMLLSSQAVDCDGFYSFSGLLDGVEYSVRLDKEDSAPINGTSTFDLVLISKHLLGTSVFNDIYPIAAADVDESGDVSILDMMMIRAVALGVIESFPGVNWYFFRAGDTEAGISFPVILSADITDFNFIGIKKGDVNGSANNCE